MTSPDCSTCGISCQVGLSFGQYLGKRLVTWRLCVTCHLREEAANRPRAGRRKEAERNG